MNNNELADLLEEAARRLRDCTTVQPRGRSTIVDSRPNWPIGQSPMGDYVVPLQLYTEVEVAKLLRISRNTVREILPSVRISKHGTRYRASDIEAFIKSKQEKIIDTIR